MPSSKSPITTVPPFISNHLLATDTRIHGVLSTFTTTAATTISSSSSSKSRNPPSPSLEGGVWIGLDLGTSNSVCAVWDSTRGSPKWIRLPPNIAPPDKTTNKWGRLVPSVVRIGHPPLIGAQAATTTTTTTTSSEGGGGGGGGTLISSVKRLLGRTLADLEHEQSSSSLSSSTSTTPYFACAVTEDDDDYPGELVLVVETTSGATIHVTPQQVLGILLKGIREGAERYLQVYATKKQFNVPGGPVDATIISSDPTSRRTSSSYAIRNVVIGVPAHFSKRQIKLVEDAARRMGGFDGVVATCLESTAAAMAYGLTLQEETNDNNDDESSPLQTDSTTTIMVLDMGGGTSDITVARKKGLVLPNDGGLDDEDEQSSGSCSFQVLVTEGEERLGGDDIDQALLDHCLQASRPQSTLLSRDATMKLLQACRTAKEQLCNLESPSHSETLLIVDHEKGRRIPSPIAVDIDQPQFEQILDPWLDKARHLIRRALVQLEQVSPGTVVSEVILVGGTTRIPAIRRMIQNEFFPNVEIGVSLNPMSSVAQGLAILAALLSKRVPLHQLRSAMMLDCIPHAIGVLLEEQENSYDVSSSSSRFVEVLKRNAPLPAKGSTTFTLADKFQPGVTIQVVEMVGVNPTVYEPIAREPFTFLLRRLTKDEYDSITTRTIEVGMKIDREGRFTVSVFDEMDPEQVRKRERFENQQKHVTIGFNQQEDDFRTILRVLWQDSPFSSDQFMLIGILVATLVMYVATKIAFSNNPLDFPTVPTA